MDVSSVNSTPVSTILESPQRPAQQAEPRNVQESRETQPQGTQQAASTNDGRVGSRVDVFV
ncbi:hypothetical protein D1814_01190 [Alteromonas sp. BL110]|uniref:hypothetical protein n=1 Tax=Alteromonas sp. BL110 TaxID=1714845 RepID=UPI000E4F4E34|nr:hypothetical protein [Alteromonas sp. BL110]AXT37393.1 hypothetical protein D1814_01190 [Alteromonas sp. BL110]RKM80130.1 hypothetical protein D7031_14540 [Alteromonas sp. BL110]